MKRLAVMVSVVAVTLVATALPFLPGRYDVHRVTLIGALAIGLLGN
jgi:hypothetical protein